MPGFCSHSISAPKPNSSARRCLVKGREGNVVWTILSSTASRLTLTAALSRGRRGRRSGGGPVLLLGKPAAATDVSLGSLQALVEREFHGDALEATHTNDVFVQRIGRARLPGVTHLADQVIAAVGTHAHGFPTAPAGHVNPQGCGVVLAWLPLEEAPQPAHTV